MNRLINVTLTILAISTLSVPIANAAQTRYEHQLQLTQHEVPATRTKQPSQSLMKAAEQRQKGQTTMPDATITPVTSGNPYTKSTRPIYDFQQQVILPLNY